MANKPRTKKPQSKKDAVKKKNEPYTAKRFLKDVAEVVIPAIILFLIIHTFFLESRFVPTESMVPTIDVHDWFLSNKTAYWFHKPQDFKAHRYDIIVFKPPAAAGSDEDYVKRIIGLPSETIEVRQGVVYINNKPLKEPYISPDRAPIRDFGPYIIPDDCVFAMGDNRNYSADSRVWGPLPVKNIKGQAWLRYWPFDRMGIVK